MDMPQDCAPLRETATCTFRGHTPLPSSGVHFGAGAATAAQIEVADPVALMPAVALLMPTQIEELSEAEAEAFVIACERITSAVHARQSLAMDTLAGRVEERLARQRHEQPQPLGVPGPDVHGTVASMLAPSLHCSTRAVSKRLEADRWLVCAAESTFSSQWQGDLERFRADVVADASADLDPALRETFEALVLETSLDEVTGELTLISPEIRQLNRAELSRRARAVARELDPQSDERAARRAHGDRRVVVTPDRRRPGMSRWHVLLPSQVSHEVFAAVDALAGQYARAHPGTPIDGHRADAFADLVLGNAQVQTTVELVVPVLAAHRQGDGQAAARGQARNGSPATADAAAPSAGRARADGDALEELAPLMARIVKPVVDPAEPNPAVTDPAAPALTDPADPADPADPTRVTTNVTTGPMRSTGEVHWVLPGSVDLPRHGELLPPVVAELLSRPETLVRLARLDPNGSIVQDPKTYRPSASLRLRLRSRDGTCRYPGCHTPAARCDLDHVVPYPAGLTEPDNLISLCRTHHRFKHHGGWRAELRPDATVAWTAPDGRLHVDRPRPLRITRDLDLMDHADSQVVHDVRRGWVPGLPVGMSMDDLVQQEALLPDEPPGPTQSLEPPPSLEPAPPVEPAQPLEPAPSLEPAPTRPGSDSSRLERHLTTVLASAA